jgi:hypothetical protein
MKKIEKLEKEIEQKNKLIEQLVEKINYYENGFYRSFTNFRGIEKTCKECLGKGKKPYGNTSIWRKSIGGNAITVGICDKCWGSGDEENPWLNLKMLDRILCDSCKNVLYSIKKEQ